MLRTLCTVLESATPVSTAVEFSNKEHEFEVDAFRLPNGATLAAVWLPGQPADDSPRVATDLHFPGISFSRATGIDVLNGTEQPLRISGGRLPGLVIKDYPIFIRLEGS